MTERDTTKQAIKAGYNRLRFLYFFIFNMREIKKKKRLGGTNQLLLCCSVCAVALHGAITFVASAAATVVALVAAAGPVWSVSAASPILLRILPSIE